MSTVKKLRPKTHDVLTVSIANVLDFASPLGISQATKDDLAQAQGRVAPAEGWGFVMLNPEQQRKVLKAIDVCKNPFITLKVWNSVISFIAYDRDGEIMASRDQIADAAALTPQHTSRALSILVEIGALLRIARGRYAINPHVGWSGPLVKREDAAKDAPKLRLVEKTAG